MVDLELLEKLEKAATKGTWSPVKHYDGGKTVCQMRSWDMRYAIDTEESCWWTYDRREPDHQAESNMHFIAAARNALPALIAELRGLRIKNLLLSEEVVRNIELLKEIDKVLESLNYDNGDQSIRHSIYIATQFSELHVPAAHFYELKYKDRNPTTDTGREG